MHKEEITNFSVLKKLINLVSFPKLVNLTNPYQSPHMKANQPHQPRPCKLCHIIMLFIFIYIKNTDGFKKFKYLL